MDSSRDQRIATLVATLKSSGIARSESQAKMMAEEMLGVEDKVQKKSEEMHAQANDYLQTSKHLGIPRPTTPVKSPSENIQVTPRREPIRNIYSDEGSTPTVTTAPHSVASSSNFGSSSSNTSSRNESSGHGSSKDSSHDTHNFLIESIKEQVSKEHIVPLYDQYMAKEKQREEANIPKPMVEPVVQKPLMEEIRNPVAEEHIVSESKPLIEQIKLETYDIDPHHIEYHDVKDVESQIQKITPIPVDLPSEVSVTETMTESVTETVAVSSGNSVEIIENVEVVEEIMVEKPDAAKIDIVAAIERPEGAIDEKPQLDAAKLAELMAEDGPMEEHTRQLPSKPEVVKPRESYPENNIDLADVFKFKR